MTNIPQGFMLPGPLNGEDAARLVWELMEALGMEEWRANKSTLMEHLRSVIRRGVQATRDAESTVPFQEAAWKSVEARAERRALTRRDLRYFVRRMLREPGISERPLRAMKTTECRNLLLCCFAHSPQSYKKARAILHSIFEFGKQQDWCSSNPVDNITPPAVREKEITPLTMEEIHQLEITTLQPKHCAMRLPLQLMLRCGLRPHEVQRLEDEDIDWQEGIVRIRPETSKTGGGRIVPLRLPNNISPVPLPRGWNRRWQALRHDAGFPHWQADILRHTFASYHAAYFRNLPALQLEMGHRDCSLLRTRYVNMYRLHMKDAEQFWKNCRLCRKMTIQQA